MKLEEYQQVVKRWLMQYVDEDKASLALEAYVDPIARACERGLPVDMVASSVLFSPGILS